MFGTFTARKREKGRRELWIRSSRVSGDTLLRGATDAEKARSWKCSTVAERTSRPAFALFHPTPASRPRLPLPPRRRLQCSFSPLFQLRRTAHGVPLHVCLWWDHRVQISMSFLTQTPCPLYPRGPRK